MSDVVSGDYAYHAGQRATRRKLHRLLESSGAGWWWYVSADIVLRDACEIANALNDRDLWVLIDRVYAKGDPWPWPEED